jgi:hypothetical protein
MTFIAFGSQKIWLFLSGCSVTLDWFERSLSLWFVLGVCLSPSLVNLSNVNMHDLGSTKFSLIFNWNSQSSACTSCCIFLARLRVIGPVGVGYVAGEVAGVPGEIGEVADAGMVISHPYGTAVCIDFQSSVPICRLSCGQWCQETGSFPSWS